MAAAAVRDDDATTGSNGIRSKEADLTLNMIEVRLASLHTTAALLRQFHDQVYFQTILNAEMAEISCFLTFFWSIMLRIHAVEQKVRASVNMQRCFDFD